MSTLPLASFDHALFDDLQLLLSRIASQPTTSLVRKLYTKLDEAQPWLLALTALPGPNDADKQALEKNPIALPSGHTIQITGDLLNLTNEISTLLSLSPLLAASLALQAIAARPRYPSRPLSQIATFLLHSYLSHLLDFLRELLRLTLTPTPDPPFDALREWVGDLLTSGGQGDGTMVDGLIRQLDELQGKMGQLIRDGREGRRDWEMTVFEVGAMRGQQGKLAGILGLVAKGGFLGRGRVVKVVKWLKGVDRVGDGLVSVVFSAFLAAATPMDLLEELDPRFEAAEEWCRDLKFLKVVSKLVYEDQWAIPRLREAAKLAWSLWLISALRHDAAVTQTGLDGGAAETLLQDAVNGEAFVYLREAILAIRRERGLEAEDETQEVAEDTLIKLATCTDPANDDFLFAQMQQIVDTLAEKKYFLRNLRNREEDVAIRRSHAGPPPTHFQGFLSLMAVVYRSLPVDSAQHLWENSSFTSAILDGRGGWPGKAFWDMMVAISSGSICAARCYERMKDGRLQWMALFKFYQHYYEIMPRLFEPIKSTRQPSLDPMRQDEVELCMGWTGLLKTVVRHSPLARSALLQIKPHPLQMLFDFVNTDVPLELKATVVEAITAFCVRTGDAADDDVISRAVEHYERISFADPGMDARYLEGGRMPAPIGWVAKMEYTESDANTYPLTRAYLHFLTVLLPLPLASSDTPPPPRPKIAATSRRAASYILDRVLLVWPHRRYARDSERWEMVDATLGFLQKALAGFNMADLLLQANSRHIGQLAGTLADEAGFVILLRLLSEPAIFAILADTLDSASAVPLARPATVDRVLNKLLRIYHRVLSVQLVFSDVLLLTLSDPTRNASSAQPFRRPMGMQSIDHLLLSRLSNVNTIALLVGDDSPVLSFLATKIVASLADSPVFSRTDTFRGEYSTSVNRLAGIMDASDDSIRIAQGFCTKLEGEGEDVSPEEIVAVEEEVLRVEIGPTSDCLASLPIVTRQAILDILLEGTTLDAHGPNLAHFLLGFEFKGPNFTLQDQDSGESRLSCLTVILDQLAQPGGSSLIYTHPTIAAKSAQLVHQLFAHPSTARASRSHAEATSEFSQSQLITLPRSCPPATRDDSEGLGAVTTQDGGEIATSGSNLVAWLEYLRWILSAVALEVFADEGKGVHATVVSGLLFAGIREAGPVEDGDDEDEDIVGGGGQRPALMVDLLGCIDIAWREGASEEGGGASRTLDYFGGFDFDRYKRGDVDWWDVQELGKGLRAYRRQVIQTQGVTSTADASKAMDGEIDYILKRLAAKNRETEIALAKGSFLGAWNETLKVGLAMLFKKHIDEDRQEVVLFELLDALLERIEGQPPGVAEMLCESVLVAMTTLVDVLGGLEGVDLPVERLALVLLKVVESVSRPGMTENARGNLYASITQFLQLVSTSGQPGNMPDDASTIAGGAAGAGGSINLHKATLQVLGARKDRLFPVLCRDAMDDRDVWKTECFALLGGLVGVCQTDRERQGVLGALSQGGYLPLFVKSIKEMEMPLLECLGPEPENLHAYWVYEAKTTFLTSYAASPRGAEELLDAGVFEVFATCGFVAVQPFSDDSTDEHTASEMVTRQHRVLICALQLLGRTLGSLHRSQRSGVGHALSFLNAHRESILALLRENQASITLTGIEECRLVVTILGMVVHKIQQEDLRSSVGFGAFHLSVLSLAARFFEREEWVEYLVIPDELQRAETEIFSLNQTILSYLLSTTQSLKSGQGFPVLTNGASRPPGGGKNGFVASAPSLQMAVGLVENLCEGLGEVSGEYESVLEAGQDALRYEDVTRWQDAGLVGDDTSFDAIALALVARSHLFSNMIESLLLLIWRHLLFYANDARGSLEPVKPDNLSSSLGAFSASHLEASRSGVGQIRALERVASILRGVLERLDDVELHPDLRRKEHGAGGGYHGMLMRRLRELTAGLTGEREGRGGGGMETD